jgi:hypothetical protein
VAANPGWYPDPRDPSRDRYWDGSKWSGQTRKRKGRGVVGWFRSLPRAAQFAIPVIAGMVIVAIAVGGNESNESNSSGGGGQAAGTESGGDAAEVDRNSRAYIEAVRRCHMFVGILILDIRKGKLNEIELAEEATNGRDACENVRTELLEMETEHFDEEAERAWYGVDRLKSGLNALLTWIDNPEPTKLVETKYKLELGMAASEAAVREINRRRREYGLPPIGS